MYWLIGGFLYLMGTGLSLSQEGGRTTNWIEDIGQFIFSNCFLIALVFGISFIFNRTMPAKRRAEISFASAAAIFFLLVVVVSFIHD